MILVRNCYDYFCLRLKRTRVLVVQADFVLIYRVFSAKPAGKIVPKNSILRRLLTDEVNVQAEHLNQFMDGTNLNHINQGNNITLGERGERGEGGGGRGGEGGGGRGERGRGGRGSSPGDKQLKTQQKSSKFIMRQPPSLFPSSPIL